MDASTFSSVDLIEFPRVSKARQQRTLQSLLEGPGFQYDYKLRCVRGLLRDRLDERKLKETVKDLGISYQTALNLLHGNTERPTERTLDIILFAGDIKRVYIDVRTGKEINLLDFARLGNKRPEQKKRRGVRIRPSRKKK